MTSALLPASELVPWIMRVAAMIVQSFTRARSACLALALYYTIHPYDRGGLGMSGGGGARRAFRRAAPLAPTRRFWQPGAGSRAAPPRPLGAAARRAGARLGFVCAHPTLIARLAEELGPWAVSGPARHAARAALADLEWHETMRKRLRAAASRLAALLAAHGLAPQGGTALFQWVPTTLAGPWHEALARRGILTRLFRDPSALRFGLPGDEPAWERLAATLAALRASVAGVCEGTEEKGQ